MRRGTDKPHRCVLASFDNGVYTYRLLCLDTGIHSTMGVMEPELSGYTMEEIANRHAVEPFPFLACGTTPHVMD